MYSQTLDIGGYREILLVRHGATDANAAGKYSGLTDLPLSDLGREQIELRRQELTDHGLSSWFDASTDLNLICSPLVRCLQTARLLWPDNKPIVEPALIETNFGSWEGMTYDQLKDDPAYRSWLDASPEHRPAPPGGESGEDILLRLEHFWSNELDLSKQNNSSERLAIVTHGGVIMYLMSLITGIPEEFYSWQLKPGGAWLLTREGYQLC